MPIYKSVQYAVWCDGDTCGDLLDFAPARNEVEARKSARAAGWHFTRQGQALCPKCHRAKRRAIPPHAKVTLDGAKVMTLPELFAKMQSEAPDASR